jgi:hypothetical protein
VVLCLKGQEGEAKEKEGKGEEEEKAWREGEANKSTLATFSSLL